MAINSGLPELLLPGDPGFYETLATPPPDWGEAAKRDGNNYAFVVEPGSGLARAVDMRDLEEYLEGGEYEERLLEISDDDELDEFFE
jgi:hypothetical protein